MNKSIHRKNLPATIVMTDWSWKPEDLLHFSRWPLTSCFLSATQSGIQEDSSEVWWPASPDDTVRNSRWTSQSCSSGPQDACGGVAAVEAAGWAGQQKQQQQQQQQQICEPHCRWWSLTNWRALYEWSTMQMHQMFFADIANFLRLILQTVTASPSVFCCR